MPRLPSNFLILSLWPPKYQQQGRELQLLYATEQIVFLQKGETNSVWGVTTLL